MIKEEKQEKILKYKSFLIITKFIPHFIALFYVLYTFLGFLGIDAIILGYFINVSILTWIYLYINSLIFRYCYVHRLPLYYILFNDAITVIDYYKHIPISDFNLLIIHLILIGLLMFGYTWYYINFKLNKNERKD